MGRAVKFVTALALSLCILSGCSPRAEAPPAYAPEESEKLVIYTSHKEEVYEPLIREFEQRTGIWVEVVTGGTNELLERIAEEQTAPQADVMFGGGAESLIAYRRYFSPYEAADSQMLRTASLPSDSHWTPFSALPVVLIYNTKLVDPQWLTGWQDLSRPEFQGRIAFADPEISASSFTALNTYLLVYGQTAENAMSALSSALGGVQLDGSGEVLSAVADGTYLVGITLEETAMKYIAAEEDIALVYPKEGTSCVPDGSAVIAGAKHGENAERFLDFTVSRCVQELLPNRFYRRSVRRDILPGDALVPLDEISVLKYDVEWASTHREQILSDWDFCQKEDAP